MEIYFENYEKACVEASSQKANIPERNVLKQNKEQGEEDAQTDRD